MNRQEKVDNWTRPAFRDLKPYYQAPLDGDPLRLDQNTHLLGPSPALSVQLADASQYPTRDSDGLRAALAELHGLAAQNFVCGNGSDELLDILCRTFTNGGTLATTQPGYSLYPYYGKLHGLTVEEIPLKGNFDIDVDGLLATRAELTIVASPNNPTGGAFAVGELERLVQNSTGVVVVDEAYIEYGGTSLLRYVENFDNLIVLRTFSKAYGLAALRIGWLAGNAELAGRLRVVKPPYNLSQYAEDVAIAALGHQEWMQAHVATVRSERERMTAALKERGFRVHASDANFLLCDSPMPPGELLAGLKAHGILARNFPGKPRLDDKIRFTVGNSQVTDQLMAAIDRVRA